MYHYDKSNKLCFKESNYNCEKCGNSVKGSKESMYHCDICNKCNSNKKALLDNHKQKV